MAQCDQPSNCTVCGNSQVFTEGLVGAHSKVLVEHLYLELAALPIPFVLAARRMIYLQTILKRHDNEIIKRIYMKQKCEPSQGDWCLLVQEYFEKMNINKI